MLKFPHSIILPFLLGSFKHEDSTYFFQYLRNPNTSLAQGAFHQLHVSSLQKTHAEFLCFYNVASDTGI